MPEKPRSGRNHRHRSFRDFILVALLKEGPQQLPDLERRMRTLQAHFVLPARGFGDGFSKRVRGIMHVAPRTSPEPVDARGSMPDTAGICVELQSEGLITQSDDGYYRLTGAGRAEAEAFETDLSMAADLLDRKLLNPLAAARNTVIADLILAVVKLLSGLLSRSVALTADGADAAVDTASACLVWIGVRFRKELLGTMVIVVMMLATGVGIGWESTTKVIDMAAGDIDAITRPYLVIAVEVFALVAAAILFVYQRFVGRRHGSLSLISQSVDSKNHIYVAAAVIAGSVSSMFGIHIVDPVVGSFVAAKILIDGVGLLREAVGSIRGQETDLSKYRIPLEKQWEASKVRAFRTWILFSIAEDGLTTDREVIESLERTFLGSYVPVLSEFDYRLGRGLDFSQELDGLLDPLLESGLISRDNGSLRITSKGAKMSRGMARTMRYRAEPGMIGHHRARKR